MYAKDYIKMEDLKDGFLYRILARNAAYGVWVADRKGFVISRWKFGDNFTFVEFHYDCENFATAQPVEEIEKSPFDGANIFEAEHNSEVLKYLNTYSRRNST